MKELYYFAKMHNIKIEYLYLNSINSIYIENANNYFIFLNININDTELEKSALKRQILNHCKLHHSKIKFKLNNCLDTNTKFEISQEIGIF
jgi:hypothetical protein